MSGAVLMIEPFYGGSHKQLVDILQHHLQEVLSIKSCVVSLPAKKWHWRARTSALYLSQIIPVNSSYKILFCSSVLNLAELMALRSDLSCLLKVIYFHENQLVYPVRKQKDRDFQYGYNQILSALVSDVVLFNSEFNLNSFLSNIRLHMNIQPDFRPKDLEKKIKPKCQVLYFPIEMLNFKSMIQEPLKPDVLHIIWPHRWEHDKNPTLFFETLFELKKCNLPFKVSILGESFCDVPDIFNVAKQELEGFILNWGKFQQKSNYYDCLRSGHVVVSTANHEFYGVAMLEATFCGCFPLACNALVYPEIYPKLCLYNTPQQLFKKLKSLCEKPYLAELYLKKAHIPLEKFRAEIVLPQFNKIFQIE